MTKTRFSTWLRNIWIIIVILSIVAGVAATFAITQVKASNNTSGIINLKKEGCSPAQQLKTQVALIQKDIGAILKTQENIQLEQTTGFDEILRRLPQ